MLLAMQHLGSRQPREFGQSVVLLVSRVPTTLSCSPMYQNLSCYLYPPQTTSTSTS